MMRKNIGQLRSFALVLVVLVLGRDFDLVYGRTSSKLRVELPHGGVLVGRFLNSFSGRGILAFLGVPYAKPPIGELRFKAPLPFGGWTGERNAITDAPLCTQRDPYRRDMDISGVEDCLQLNVYVPERPANGDPLPVMVFFHGGGWQCGSGTRSFYGPDFLLDHDVIYVGANFRLGPLGFLSTEQEDCPGNNGLKDQNLVLKWIQENIASFGGNPRLVTVFGESAGGASGTYHMMSPLSRGLFHRVISQSGVNLDSWALPTHPGVARKRSIQLGEMLGCSQGQTRDFRAMIDCLRKVPAEDVTKAFYNFFTWDTDPMIPFPPVVEPNLPGAFITKHPREEYEPHAIALPWMTGLTMDEGALKSASLINLPEIRANLNEHWDRALPVSLNYDHHDERRQQEITNAINKFYFNNQQLIKETEQNLTNLYTDAWFLAGMDEYLHIRLEGDSRRKTPAGPTYVYLFAQRTAASFTEIFEGGQDKYYGVCHAEELQFLFPIARDLFVTSIPTPEELEVRRIITKLWVNFARTGNPTPAEDDELPRWPTTDGFPLVYLRIGSMNSKQEPLLAVESGLFEARSNFWRELKAHHHPDHVLSKDEL
ncbi:carboxylic ester hydrolase [Malaya genurostris]|uniref:carboxylic ester hydrolase n=1 Tax=Malaya genurostris TaxID=325434 RepID=UPI0026F38708|nr:carboxylic ester hydrolase [Malaya genurostris]